MKNLLIIILMLVASVGFSQQLDSKIILSGSDLSYYDAAEMEIDTYLKNTCHQLNAAKRAMVLDYGLLNYEGKAKRNIVGLKRVQGWNAVLQIKYGCTEKNYYDFTEFLKLKTQL